MDMFWHKDVSRYKKAVMFPHLFQLLLEDVVTRPAFEERRPLETTEGDEVKMAGMLKTDQTAGHDGEILHLRWSSLWLRVERAKARAGWLLFVPPFAKAAKDGPPAKSTSEANSRPADGFFANEVAFGS